MPVIHVLPDLLVNRIAAGEVIERPASVVKEVVENAIDAEATRIDVTVEDGGRALIRVADNGVGMDAEDLRLCVMPHATSKIVREEDLFAIGTMGFRGEALPSIAAVCEMRVVSQRRGADAAFEVRASGARVEEPVMTGASPGTTVEVRNLFFNVPARQKFLRTAQTELGHITEHLARLALAHPRIEFRLLHNGREVHRLVATDSVRDRVADFYGRELADALIPIGREERGVGLRGLVAPPAQSRSSGRWEYTFLNGRFIRDKFVQHAVREAYRGLIDPRRYPVTFVMLTIDPRDVDVNVHPTKVEVRWRDSNLIHSLTLRALRDAFLTRDLTVPLATEGRAVPGAREEPGEFGEGVEGEDAEARREQVRRALADFFKSQPRPSGQASLPYAAGGGRSGTATGTTVPRMPLSPARQGAFQTPAQGSADAAPVAAETEAGAPEAEVDERPRPRLVTGERFLQVHDSYLVGETEEGLIIVDQHALHERVLYEEFSAQIARGPLESQRLLIPETVEVPAEHLSVLETRAGLLARLGLELTAFGKGAVAVHACPSRLRGRSVAAFVRDLVETLANKPDDVALEALLEDSLAMMACKAAVKAGDALTPEEIEALLARRESVERGTNCPHGRPTTLRLTLADLEKQFKRA